MDKGASFEDFKNTDFNVDIWLRKSLTNYPENVDPKIFIDEISKELDIRIQHTKSDLHNLAQEMVGSIPRLTRDLEGCEREVGRLKIDMGKGLYEAESVQKKTTTSLSTLEKCDGFKTRLVSISAALQEADKWTSLSKQIEQLLDSGDVAKSFDCLLGMERSLAVLNESESVERKLILEEMKNRLEALATKHLILAFDTNNAENSRYFFHMFGSLGRSDQFIKYFQTTEKNRLIGEWRKMVELLSFKEASAKFCDLLIDHWYSKVQWCRVLFAEDESVNGGDVLVEIYGDILRSLDPSLHFCFEVEAKKVPYLELLINFNQTAHRFVQNFKFAINSQNMRINREKQFLLFQSIFSPFLDQYGKYRKHHENLIVSKIKSSASTVAADSQGQALSFQESLAFCKRLLPELILAIKEAEEKVNLFNEGFAYVFFGSGISKGLERFIEFNHDILKKMEKSQGEEDERNLLENSLAFAENCGEMYKELKGLDESMKTEWKRVYGSFNASEYEEGDLRVFYTDEGVEAELRSFLNSKESLLAGALDRVSGLCKEATSAVLRLAARPVTRQLTNSLKIGEPRLKEPIPSDYITNIGEYLMLLPQNVDPFLTNENSVISTTFLLAASESERPPIDFILSNLANSTCEAFAERILKITYLGDGQARQLVQDIDYLSGVLEDLGLRLTNELGEIQRVLKVYSTLPNDVTGLEKVNQNTIATIIKMKNKPLS